MIWYIDRGTVKHTKPPAIVSAMISWAGDVMITRTTRRHATAAAQQYSRHGHHDRTVRHNLCGEIIPPGPGASQPQVDKLSAQGTREPQRAGFLVGPMPRI